MSQTELCKHLKNGLECLSRLISIGNFELMDQGQSNAGIRRYGSLSVIDVSTLHALARQHQARPDQTGTNMTREELIQVLQVTLEALGGLYQESKFTPTVPSLEAGAKRYGMESAETLKDLFLLVIGQKTRTRIVG